MKLTGAQILLKCLEKEGVDVMFGFLAGPSSTFMMKYPNHPLNTF